MKMLHKTLLVTVLLIGTGQVSALSTSICAQHAVKHHDVCQATQQCMESYLNKAEDFAGAKLASPQTLDEKEKRVHYHITRATAYAYHEESIYKSIIEINKAYELAKQMEDFIGYYDLMKVLLIQKGSFELRLGELKNCINNHNADSCIFPLSKNAQHSDQHGSKAAIKTFEEYLHMFGEDSHIEWVLNLAYQTLGEYPQKVPEDYLIAPELFASDMHLNKFKDVAGPLGLQKKSHEAGGIAVEDFNGDGHLDIMITSLGFCDSMLYFENDGQGGFVDKTQKAGLMDVKNQIGILAADYDNDGDTDVYFSSGGWENSDFKNFLPNKFNYLYRNDGNGKFTEATVEAGLRSGRNHTIGSKWADIDNDGWLDMLVCNEFGPVEIFKNQQGQFSKQLGAAQLGDPKQRCKSATFGDINNDGWLDLYLSYHNHRNYLYLNNQGKGFIPVEDSVVNLAPRFGFVAWFFDYNNDGWQDLFVASFNAAQGIQFGQQIKGEGYVGETMKLFQNMGYGAFMDVTLMAGLDVSMTTMGINFGDVNNDGYEDIYFGTGGPRFDQLEPNRLFVNDKGHFKDVTTVSGVGNLQKGHGIGFVDIDNDGDQDILAQFGGAFPGDKFFPSLYINPGNGGNWLNLRLEGSHANRSAIGARIHIRVKTADGSERSIHHMVNHGGSFGSNSLQAEIGLGDAQSIVSLSIRWTGLQSDEVFNNVELNQTYSVKEGSGELTKMDLPVFDYVGANANKHSGHQHH